jgi:hypothetical protein
MLFKMQIFLGKLFEKQNDPGKFGTNASSALIPIIYTVQTSTRNSLRTLLPSLSILHWSRSNHSTGNTFWSHFTIAENHPHDARLLLEENKELRWRDPTQNSLPFALSVQNSYVIAFLRSFCELKTHKLPTFNSVNRPQIAHCQERVNKK